MSFPPPPPPLPDDVHAAADDAGRRRSGRTALVAGAVGVVVGFGAVVAASLAWSGSSTEEPPDAIAASAIEPAPDELPPEIADLRDGLGTFAECLADRLAGDDPEAGLPSVLGAPGTVVVVTPDGELSLGRLGEGDGRIVVERSDGEVSVEASGDASVEGADALGDLLAGSLDGIGEALEACRAELPDLPPLGDVLGDVLGEVLGDAGLDGLPALDELPLDELPGLEDLPLDELPDLDELLDQLPDLDELVDDLLDGLPPELREPSAD